MMKQQFIVSAGLVALVVLAGVVTYFFVKGDEHEAPVPVVTTQTTKQDTVAGTVTVDFSDNGFGSALYTVKAGQTLHIENNSTETLQFSSDDHPTHRLNGELNTPAVAPGGSVDIIPERVGTFGVHDHMRSQFTTTVKVVQ